MCWHHESSNTELSCSVSKLNKGTLISAVVIDTVISVALHNSIAPRLGCCPGPTPVSTSPRPWLSKLGHGG